MAEGRCKPKVTINLEERGQSAAGSKKRTAPVVGPNKSTPRKKKKQCTFEPDCTCCPRGPCMQKLWEELKKCSNEGSLDSLKKLKVDDLRRFVTKGMKMLRPDDTREKPRYFYQDQPSNWPPDVPFGNPSNSSKGHKFNKQELVKMAQYLLSLDTQANPSRETLDNEMKCETVTRVRPGFESGTGQSAVEQATTQTWRLQAERELSGSTPHSVSQCKETIERKGLDPCTATRVAGNIEGPTASSICSGTGEMPVAAIFKDLSIYSLKQQQSQIHSHQQMEKYNRMIEDRITELEKLKLTKLPCTDPTSFQTTRPPETPPNQSPDFVKEKSVDEGEVANLATMPQELNMVDAANDNPVGTMDTSPETKEHDVNHIPSSRLVQASNESTSLYARSELLSMNMTNNVDQMSGADNSALEASSSDPHWAESDAPKWVSPSPMLSLDVAGSGFSLGISTIQELIAGKCLADSIASMQSRGFTLDDVAFASSAEGETEVASGGVCPARLVLGAPL